jgi:hypothetical protein
LLEHLLDAISGSLVQLVKPRAANLTQDYLLWQQMELAPNPPELVILQLKALGDFGNRYPAFVHQVAGFGQLSFSQLLLLPLLYRDNLLDLDTYTLIPLLLLLLVNASIAHMVMVHPGAHGLETAPHCSLSGEAIGSSLIKNTLT